MHISEVSLVNYRNFKNTKVILKPGVNTIIGENGSGKSNLFRAIRLLLDENLVGRSFHLDDGDFHRGLGDWRGHWIVLTLQFDELSNDEAIQSLLLQRTAEEKSGATDKATYSLVFRPKSEIRDRFARLEDGDHLGLFELQNEISIDDYERVLLGKTNVDLTIPEEYLRVVGDFDNVKFPRDEKGYAPPFEDELGIRIPRELSLWKEFAFTFIPALRDVVADFSDVRRNPLRTLLTAKSNEIPQGELDEILGMVRDLNTQIEVQEDVNDLTSGIQRTFKDTVGETFSPTSMKIKSELPLEASDLFKSLKLYVGENGDSDPRRLHEMSLGGANLVYLTLKLLEFQYRTARQAVANFLLIEEPEAHIHTHVQKTLFDRVEYQNTQIIYSTHSTQISEVSKIDRVNVLSREGKEWRSLRPSAGLEKPDRDSAQRFLDAVRCNLLFARSVLLVEGDAEEILIPGLIKAVYGISLDEIGVSLINVRSTGFENLGNLFHPDRLRKQCVILTDHDQPYFDVEPSDSDKENVRIAKTKAVGSAAAGRARKAKLDEYSKDNPFVHVVYSEHTFEVDFAKASKVNRKYLIDTIKSVYSRGAEIAQVTADLEEDSIAKYGAAALRLANADGKGWYALKLVGAISQGFHGVGATIPQYILEALGRVTERLPAETWIRIIAHRIDCWQSDWDIPTKLVDEAKQVLRGLETGSKSLATTLDEISVIYADEQLNGLSQAFKDA